MMILNAHWPSILEDARQGDLEDARQGRQLDPGGSLADYFYGRCLTEAGVELDEAIACLKSAAIAEPANPLVTQTLALALARTERPTHRAAAAEIWSREGLPMDLDLLGQVSLTLEAQTRPWPEPADVPDLHLPWPEGLPAPAPEPLVPPPADLAGFESAGESATPRTALDCDKMSRVCATKTKKPTWGQARTIERMEGLLMEHQPLKVLDMATELINQGVDSAELHLVAGLAADEAGISPRARAHLSRADLLEPGMLLARTWLGRAYWRCGWADLALALWRSIPVEGPYDYGRHYHLALAHDALGNRPGALAAMGVALDRFYFDTRHFYIKRALEAWLRRFAPGVAAK